MVNTYAYALDERAWPQLDDVFADEAVARYAGPDGPLLEGRPAIIEAIRSFLDDCGPTQHLLGNHLIELDHDMARSKCKARVAHYGAGDRSSLIPYECFGIYHDELRRTPQGLANHRPRLRRVPRDRRSGHPRISNPRGGIAIGGQNI
ncbi:nuclear transport factor 2 family protein [Nocardia gamkensis]|uniref:nuclear transport factor 2 family protein n=1 Tax=Nocardia gamkensis TaxID=352869 RepID=UPI0037C88AFF